MLGVNMMKRHHGLILITWRLGLRVSELTSFYIVRFVGRHET